MSKDKDLVQDIVSKSIYFTSMEPAKNTESEGRYLLATTQNKLYCNQREVDNLLGKYHGQNETLGRRKTPLVHNPFSTYAAALQRNDLIIKTAPTFSSPPTYDRLVTISFSTNPE